MEKIKSLRYSFKGRHTHLLSTDDTEEYATLFSTNPAQYRIFETIENRIHCRLAYRDKNQTDIYDETIHDQERVFFDISE